MTNIKILNYNVSNFAIQGKRRGVWAINPIYPRTPERFTFLSSYRDLGTGKPPNLYGSTDYQSEIPLDNIVDYLLAVYREYDIINLIEANQDLINRLKYAISSEGPNGESTHYILRFWEPTMTEALYLVIRKTLPLIDAFCLSMSSTINPKKKAIGIVVFEQFVFVGVHLMHPITESRDERLNVLEILKMSLMHIFNKLDQMAIIIGGDFNSEEPLTQFYKNKQLWHNSPLDLKTAYTMVKSHYFKTEGERPLQFAYDRFCWTPKVKVTELPEIDWSSENRHLHLTGQMSDHLPVEATFKVPTKSGFDPTNYNEFFLLRDHYFTETQTIEHGAYIMDFYPFGVDQPNLEDNTYTRIFDKH